MTQAATEDDRRLQALAAATASFAEATSDYEKLLDAIARGGSDVLACFSSVALLSDDELMIAPKSFFDPDPGSLALMRALVEAYPSRLLPGMVTTQVVQSGKRMVVPKLDPGQLAARLSPEDRARLPAEAPKGFLLCPLRTQGRTIGLMMFVRHGPTAEPLTERDGTLAQTLADHAAVSITNARLYASLQRELAERTRATERLRVLTDAARDFSAAVTSASDLPDRIARRLATTIGDMCMMQFLNPDDGSLERGAAHHRDPAQQATAQLLIGAVLPMGEGVLGRVAASGRSIRLPEVTRDQILAGLPPERRALAEQIDIGSVMAAPFLSEGKTVGVIAMVRGEGRPGYSAEDLRLLEELAAHAVIAVSNERLLGMLRRELAERKRAEEALGRTEAQLRQAQKMEAIGRLAGGVAHDFNNLLSVVLSYSNLLLLDLPEGAAMRDELDEIRLAGERAAELTRQLLAFSRQQLTAPRLIDLGALVEGMDKLIRRLIGEDVELTTAGGMGRWSVRADPGQIEQVVMNLVVNARDAMPDGGHLTVETADIVLDGDYARTHLGVEPGPHVMLAVSDTGDGMDKATQERIFEPFFTTKEKGKGTGLGLSTVFGIVKQAGGTVWVSSEVGTGTTFKIYLPRAEGAAQALPDRTPSTMRVEGTETILLVEDEDQVRHVAREILQRHGYQVIEASHGEMALGKFALNRDRIALLLTDVVMPKMGGRELAGRIHALTPGLKTLFMSGYTDDAIVHHQVFEHGVALLQKPIRPDALLRRVREVLDA